MGRKTYPFDDQFDFEYQPSSYWPDLPTEATVLSKIKGTARRDIASRALEGEELVRLGDDELYRDAMELVLQDGLDEEDRRHWGSVHPSMMGGEFLPDPGEGEVEIARIELASTTGDVIQVLAQPSNTHAKRPRIRYRVVDEYWDEGSRYDVSPKSTARPLSLGQLVDLIDRARRVGSHSFENERYDVGLVDGLREANLEEGQEEESLRDFFRVTSAFYPELAAYYDARSNHWFQKVLLDRLDDEADSAL